MLFHTLNKNPLNTDTNHKSTIHSAIKKKTPSTEIFLYRKSLDDHNHSVQRLQKTSPSNSNRHKIAFLTYPSLFKNKRASFQKFIQCRQKLVERGKRLNEVAKSQSYKMITIQQRNSIYTSKQNQNWCDHFTQAQTIPVLLSKKSSKNLISCRGQSFRSYDGPIEPPKIKRIKYNPSIRFSEPFDQYKRACTMPQFNPWVAEAMDEGITQRVAGRQQI